MTRKYSSISVETTLASGINTTQTTMQVVSSAAATSLLGGQTLAAGNVDIFTVVIDPDTASEEIVFITDVSGDTFTISRGQAGTGSAGVSGIAHSAGATVRHVLTSSDLNYFRDGLPSTISTAKGDLVAATAANTVTRLAVGTNGQVLKADSSAATGLAWGSITTGKVLQVVQGTNTTTVSNSTSSPVDTGLSASITPSSSSSKVLVLVSSNTIQKSADNSFNGINYTLLRGSTVITGNYLVGYTHSTALNIYLPVTFSFLDSPSTTSSTTYKTQIYNVYAGPVVQTTGNTQSIILLEIGA
jgi:hypothetical protein